MSRFLEDAACAAIGYGVGALRTKNKAEVGPDAIKHAIEANPNIPLSCIVEDWARVHGIFGRNNDLSRELSRIAEQYYDPYA